MNSNYTKVNNEKLRRIGVIDIQAMRDRTRIKDISEEVRRETRKFYQNLREENYPKLYKK